MRGMFKVVAVATMLTAGAGFAQDKAETLADIRQELTVLYVELQKLKRELSTTGATGSLTGGSILDRVAAIESELQRLTGKTEQLEFRVSAIVKDGTSRVSDLEFRLVELEGGDVSALGETPTLGGDVADSSGPAVPVSQPAATDAPQLAMGEQADFDAARAAFEAGDHQGAAAKYAAFNDTYPGSPMAASAHLGRGQALEAAGDLTGAARAYLDAFSTEPNGRSAPEALYHLGNGLGRLGQTSEACVTLAEVGVRFPGGSAETKAREAMARLGCS
ncbi:tol-pal system protein YbgF [Alisedimentitalea sp. MJ-SS2]|uniref:tol-pal system protein YbgF n=1 Tax=Aliisedimentitalea sp. MJ-SS2 TaxID=3049795 RepID=UPI00290D183F|nr:tol-pal system protein YbgF [Alisedimentitalea sp. MJ-SS2]MDU8927297.1 tol-pal system protein YbgF [Alisedimentitalea sp. MJ-SS2]